MHNLHVNWTELICKKPSTIGSVVEVLFVMILINFKNPYNALNSFKLF